MKDNSGHSFSHVHVRAMASLFVCSNENGMEQIRKKICGARCNGCESTHQCLRNVCRKQKTQMNDHKMLESRWKSGPFAGNQSYQSKLKDNGLVQKQVAKIRCCNATYLCAAIACLILKTCLVTILHVSTSANCFSRIWETPLQLCCGYRCSGNVKHLRCPAH